MVEVHVFSAFFLRVCLSGASHSPMPTSERLDVAFDHGYVLASGVAGAFVILVVWLVG
jgi:hypothetical protein